MSAPTAAVLPIALGAMFVGAGLVVLVYAVACEVRRLLRRPTPPSPLALVASRPEPAPTREFPVYRVTTLPERPVRAVGDTHVLFVVRPEYPTQILPQVRGGRHAR